MLDVIRDEGLMENAAHTGALLRDSIAGLARRHAAIGDVRAAGLYLGIEIRSDPAASTASGAPAARLVEGLRRAGVLVGTCGAVANVIKLRPPLTFGPAEAALFLDRLDAVLGAVAAGRP